MAKKHVPHDEWKVPDRLYQFSQELPERRERGEWDRDLEKQVDKEWKAFRKHLKPKRGIAKKTAVASISVAAACAIFVGSAFISPAMAKVASHIPYLSTFFEDKPVMEEIREALDGKGYKWDGLGVSVNPKEVSVTIVGSEDYYQKVKSPVKDLIRDILKSRDFDAYDIKVSQAPPVETPTAEDKEEMAKTDRIFKVVGQVLHEFGHDNVGYGLREQIVELDLPDTESREKEIKENIAGSLQEEGLGTFSVKVHTFNAAKQERESRWMPLVSTISDGLTAKKEYHVKSVGYTNRHKDFTIIISTNQKHNDPAVNKTADSIRDMVDDFLHTDKIRTITKGEPYQLTIYSRDGKVVKP
ncbi:DUF4030 domain-containing protein [Peribacillus sp. SCS-155]|uniref:DUF4030 domain-containing protein n=1 Tax=Peribacillus sedimenti TaxID=3115297 RepID=UPI003906536F